VHFTRDLLSSALPRLQLEPTVVRGFEFGQVGAEPDVAKERFAVGTVVYRDV